MQEDIKLKIFEKIAQIRKEDVNLSKKDFAEKLDINVNTYRKYEKRSIPDVETLKKICACPPRKVRPAWVLFNEEPRYVDMVANGKEATIDRCMMDCTPEEKHSVFKLIEIFRHDYILHKNLVTDTINTLCGDKLWIREGKPERRKKLTGRPGMPERRKKLFLYKNGS